MRYPTASVWLVVILDLLRPGASWAQRAAADSTLEHRVTALEAKVEALAGENRQLRQDREADARTGLGAMRPAGREPYLSIGGLLQTQAEFGAQGDSRYTNGNDRVFVRRARLNGSGRYLEEFEFRVELELAGSVANAPALRAQLTDGYIAWTRFPSVVVRAGQFKIPFGFEQLSADPRLVFVERTLVSDRLGLGRQPGVQVSGDLCGKRVAYALAAANGTGANSNANDNGKFLGAARVSAVPWRHETSVQNSAWAVGADFYHSEDAAVLLGPDFGFDSTPATPAQDDVFAGRRQGLGVDTQLSFHAMEFWAEYLRTRFDVTNHHPRARLTTNGWYVQGSYPAQPNRLQAVVRYDAFDPQRVATSTAAKAWTLGLNYYFKAHDIKLMGDYVHVFSAGANDGQQKILGRLQTAF